ncbi:WbqC family protein [Gracilimonas halophila]|uniref:WbqC family protein n=1 Tax=Gracilimonas halophila TaxID=1834464 RepID=A0ABW5JIP6_9BACT
MRLALLQPQFAPNLYDLSAMLKADMVVWNDLEQWSRKGRTHRAAIKGEQGLQWVNIPIKTEDKKKSISEVRIEHSEDWIDPFWNALHHNYSEATWYDFFAEELEFEIRRATEFEKLIDFNIYFFDSLQHFLEFKIEFQLASTIPEFDPNPDIFAERVGADILFQEQDSKNYQWLSDDANTVFDEKSHPRYNQLGDSFLPGCSVLDLLFNKGKESFSVLGF